MGNLQLTHVPMTKTGMLIRKPMTAKAIEPNRRIVLEWPAHKGTTTV